MNTPAVELYTSKGLDITKDYLEIALCAQHNNGGIAVDMWWQSEVKGLYAAGECAGTHGITRPGGSALNAGQVGSLRAAQYVSYDSRLNLSDDIFDPIADAAKDKHLQMCDAFLCNENNVDELLVKARRRMSQKGGAIRDIASMKTAVSEILKEIKDFNNFVGVKNCKSLYKAYKLYDALTVQIATLYSFINFAEHIGKTRGSALYQDTKGALREGLDELFRFTVDDGKTPNEIQQIRKINGEYVTSWRTARPLPENDDFFENIWKSYRENKNIY